jgi:ABC-2 type transport system permease protein
MFNQIFALARKEFQLLFHDRGSLIALFGLPIAFILVMTVALDGVFTSGTSGKPIVMLVSNQDKGQLAAQVIDNLRSADGLSLIETYDGLPLTAAKIDELITAKQYMLGVDFPADFSDAVLNSGADSSTTKPVVRFIVDPTANNQILAPARGLVEGHVERVTSYALMESQTQAGFDAIAQNAPASQQAFMKQIEDEFTAGQEKAAGTGGVEYKVTSPAQFKLEKEPTSVEQNVPAYTIYGVFFILQVIATGFFEEKNSGAFQRLKAAPLSRAAYLTGKGLSYVAINLVQIVLMFAVGVLVFHINLGRDPLALLVISIVTALAATGLGMMVTCFVRTQEQASSLGTLLGVVLAVIGGMMVPAYVMPDFMQKLSWATPHAWALSAYQDVIVRGMELPQILPTLGVLSLFALGFWAVAIIRFKFD